MSWESVGTSLTSARPISKFEHLMGRVDRDKQLDVLLPDAAAPAKEPAKSEAKAAVFFISISTCRVRARSRSMLAVPRS